MRQPYSRIEVTHRELNKEEPEKTTCSKDRMERALGSNFLKSLVSGNYSQSYRGSDILPPLWMVSYSNQKPYDRKR